MRAAWLVAAIAIAAARGLGPDHARLLGGQAAPEGIEFSADTMLLVGTLDGALHAISGASGDLLWSFDSGGKVVSSSFLARLEAARQPAAGGTQHDLSLSGDRSSSSSSSSHASAEEPLPGEWPGEGADGRRRVGGGDDAAGGWQTQRDGQGQGHPQQQHERERANTSGKEGFGGGGGAFEAAWRRPPAAAPRRRRRRGGSGGAAVGVVGRLGGRAPVSPPPSGPIMARRRRRPRRPRGRGDGAAAATAAAAAAAARARHTPPSVVCAGARRARREPRGAARRRGGRRGRRQPPPPPRGAEESAVMAEEEEGGGDEAMLVVPGLDGRIFVIGEEGDTSVLGDHTIQELVAEPTIFGGRDEADMLVGAKSVRLHAINPLTGEALYSHDTSDADVADGYAAAAAAAAAASREGEDASVPYDAYGEYGEQQPPRGQQQQQARHGQLLVSREDFSVRVLEKASGRQRWNVTLAQYSLEFVGGGEGGGLAQHFADAGGELPPSQRLSLHLDESPSGELLALCAASPAGDGEGGGGSGERCSWRHTFTSQPVMMYRIETSTGHQQQLAFAPRVALDRTSHGLPAPIDGSGVAGGTADGGVDGGAAGGGGGGGSSSSSTSLSTAVGGFGGFEYYNMASAGGFELVPWPSTSDDDGGEWGALAGGASDSPDGLAVAIHSNGAVGRPATTMGAAAAGVHGQRYPPWLGATAPLVPLLPYVSPLHPMRLALPDPDSLLAPGKGATATATASVAACRDRWIG